MEVSGWGRYPRHQSETIIARDPASVGARLADGHGIIARGMGRAYGDAAIGRDQTLSTLCLDRVRAFDRMTGRITVEAGLLLADLIETFLPRGFFPPVVPGTKYVTIGGMIAADVHGKNHHRDGGFGRHVERLRLALPDGKVADCSPDEKESLFRATIGGMGLTGVILEATFRLRQVETGWIRQETLVAEDLSKAIAALMRASSATYSVAWIDCVSRGRALGRSLIYVGEHASRAEVEAAQTARRMFPPARKGLAAVPIDLPGWTLNRFSIAAFNDVYYRRGRAKSGSPHLVAWEPYFFPLDGVGQWNRIYGRRGFLQHQSVIPMATAPGALAEMLDRIARFGTASFLTVLKQLGPGGSGAMSFPMEGLTLALDFPMTRGILPFLDELDDIVVKSGGRIYLAKDARQSRDTFEAGYPDLPQFRDLRRSIGASGRLVSRLSERLEI
jgi:FAD/FMN-containing dehydrogenase